MPVLLILLDRTSDEESQEALLTGLDTHGQPLHNLQSRQQRVDR